MRIVGSHVALDTMRLETMLCPDPGNRHVADTQMPAQLASAPMGRSIIGLAPGRVQDARLELGRERSGRLPHVPVDQAGDACFEKALFPPHDGGATALQLIADRLMCFPCSQGKDDARSLRLRCTHAMRADHLPQLMLIGVGNRKRYRLRHEIYCSTQSPVTSH